MKRITYIITHKESTPDRRSNLHTVLDWLNHINEVEKVIIVEQDSAQRLIDIENHGFNRNYEIEYKFINNPNTFFNKSWAFNVGAKLANTEWLAFGDSDVIMNPNSLNSDMIETLDNFDSFTPYETVFDLSPKETDIMKNDKVYGDIRKKASSVRGGAPYGGGIFFIKRDAFYRIGAWDERFVNWGAEDEDITHRIQKNIKFTTKKRNSYHLHHARTIHSTHQNEFYNNNLKIYLSRRDKTLDEILKDFDINEIGLDDKYTKD